MRQISSSIRPYLVSACLFALCISFGHWYSQNALEKQAYDGIVIDIAGRQRMLSQRLLAYAILVDNDQKVIHNIKELRAITREWKTAHFDLLEGNPSKNIPALSMHHQHALTELSPLLEESILDINALMKNKEISISDLQNRLTTYLPKMNEIVNLLAADSRAKFAEARTNGIIFTICLLTVLFILLFFFLIPAHRKNIKLINQLRFHEEKMEQQVSALKQANEGLNHFMYVASHDMKTPLRSIGSFATLIKRRYSDQIPEGALEYFEYIKDNATSMSRVLDDLVKFNKAGEERKLEIVDLDLILRQVKLNLSANLNEVGAILIVDVLGKATGSEVVISQVLQNLILNAITYRNLERQCRITIKRKSSPSGTTLIVTDNGVGLDIKYREKVFLPFQRVGELDRPGSGIGLSICRKLAQSTGGDINYEGEVGVGTSFHFGLDCSPKFETEDSVQEVLA